MLVETYIRHLLDELRDFESKLGDDVEILCRTPTNSFYLESISFRGDDFIIFSGTRTKSDSMGSVREIQHISIREIQHIRQINIVFEAQRTTYPQGKGRRFKF